MFAIALDTLFGLGPSATSFSDRCGEDDRWFGGVGSTVSKSGVTVTESTALMYATVFACVEKLAKTISTLPVGTFDRTGERTRTPVDDPLNWILNVSANENSSGPSAREALFTNLLLWGNGYAEIERSNVGEVIALHPLPSSAVKPETSKSGKLFYEFNDNGTTVAIAAENMLHIPGLTLGGIVGLSPIGLQREAIGLGMGATTFGATFFGNGATPGGFLEMPEGKTLSTDAMDRMKATFNEKFQGPDRAHSVALLEDGTTYRPNSIPQKDAQFLETRQFAREDICGIFDVPPAKIQDLTHGTFSNVEQQDLTWAKDSLLPWCIRFEAAIKRRFFPDDTRYVKHNLAGIMRGDLKTRYESYAIGRQWGWLSANDIRAVEDMNPLPAGGDEYLVPMNMVVAGEPRAQITDQSTSDDTNASAEMFLPLCADAARRIVAKEVKAVGNSFKKRAKEDNADGFHKWLDRFYTEHVGFAVAVITPLCEGCELGVDPLDIATAHCQLSRDKCARTAEGLPARFIGLLDAWAPDAIEELTQSIYNLITKE